MVVVVVVVVDGKYNKPKSTEYNPVDTRSRYQTSQSISLKTAREAYVYINACIHCTTGTTKRVFKNKQIFLFAAWLKFISFIMVE